MHIVRWAAAAGVAIPLLVAIAEPSLAHVTVDTADGRYAIELGFEEEPTYLGQPNALFLKVSEYGTGGARPVDDLAGSLTAEVEKNGQTMDLPLVPLREGAYRGGFYPTAPGDYTFRVSGDINGSPVDIEESSSPTTFNSVEPLTAVQFPEEWPAPNDMATQLHDAEAAASSARTFGLAGVGLSVLGVVLAGLALARKR